MKNILIRAEDKNIWERRAAITPADLKFIVEETGGTAFIEKSDKRFFKEQEYVKAGARETEGMDAGDVIFGVKEIPVEKILDNKIYLFFSHTIKAQKENMAMLRRIIESGSTLIDYEKITDDLGRRLVFFGPYAGDAGAIDILWLMGEHWQNRGIETPFSQIKQARNYISVADAKEKIKLVGGMIKKEGLPEELCPMVFGILGYGNVSKGAQQILGCLPAENIRPDELEAFFKNGKFDRNKIYISIFKEENLAQPDGDFSFDLQDYYQHPEKYGPKFTKYLPYISVLVNATYWEKRYPKFVTWNDLKELKETGNIRLQGIADITCDIGGSIECNVKTTDSGMPAYRVFPETKTAEDGHKGDGIVLLAVDNLPCELPKDSSEFFSNSLRPLIPGILQADYLKPLAESGLPDEVKRAVIVYNGKLTADFQYLEKHLDD